MNQYKTCTSCKQTYSLDNFHNDKTRKDGKFPQCRQCQKAQSRTYYQANKEKVKARAKDWKDKNPEKVQATRQRYISVNREKNREYQREWAKQFRKNNPLNHRRWPSSSEKLREWRNKNPEKTRAQKLRRRSRIKGLKDYQIRWKDLEKLLQGNCFYCGQKATQIDHVIPVSRGGTHSIGNLVGACSRCNQTKSDSLIVEWRMREKKAA